MGSLAALPEISYPSPFVIKNTFINTMVPRLDSLVDLEERKVQPCPVSAIFELPGVADAGPTEEDNEFVRRARRPATIACDAVIAVTPVPVDQNTVSWAPAASSWADSSISEVELPKFSAIFRPGPLGLRIEN